MISRSSPPGVFLGKGFLKTCSKINSITPMPKFDFNNEIIFLHGCAISLLHIFKTHFLENNSGGLLLNFLIWFFVADTTRQLIFASCNTHFTTYLLRLPGHWRRQVSLLSLNRFHTLLRCFQCCFDQVMCNV